MFQKPFSKKLCLFLLLFLFFLLTLASFFRLSTVFTAKVFSQLTGTLFRKEVTSSTLTLHYTLTEPESYGITEIPVCFQPSDDADAFSEHCQKLLSSLDPSCLSRSDQITYDILLLLLRQNQTAAQFEGYPEPLGSTIGLQAQLPILLCEYRFDSARDIHTYLQLLSTTDQYFSSLLSYERQKAARGLFMPSSCADGIIRQCQAFLDADLSDHLLITSFQQKISAMATLSSDEKQNFLGKNRQIILQHVLPAYQLLIQGLTDLKKSCRNEMGLTYLPQGRAYYEYLVQSSTGSGLSIHSIQNRIQAQLLEDASVCRQILQQYPSAAGLSTDFVPTDPAFILLDLQQKMAEDFPSIPDTEYQLKYVDDALSPYLSPAFYLTAPVDAPDQNVIYLNPSAGYSGLDLYTTLAHEGFPGHLYQNRYSSDFLSPLRSLFGFSGYTEGWATYVEMISYDYAAAGRSDTEHAAVSLAQKQRSMMLGLSSLIDILVHYHGYTREEVRLFLRDLGIAGTSVSDSIYDAVLESPANYLKYYLGYLSFLDLRRWCQKNWPEQFQISTFHQYVLEIGPCPFPVLEKYLKLCYTGSL